MHIAGGADEKNQTAAGGPRAKERSKNTAGGDGCAQQFSVEKFCDQVCDRHRAPTEQAIHVLLARKGFPDLLKGVSVTDRHAVAIGNQDPVTGLRHLKGGIIIIVVVTTTIMGFCFG